MRTNKRKTKKRYIKRRHTRKQIRRQTKRRQYRHKKYYGGRFNEVQEEQLRNKIREIGFTDEAEINELITILGRTSQLFADPSGFQQTLHQIQAFTDPEEFRQWVRNGEPDEDLVETDPENTPTD